MEIFYALGFSTWKKQFLASFFAPEIQLEFKKKPIKKALHAIPDGVNVVIWASHETSYIRELARKKECPLWRMEDGFIRSVGLGVDLTPPLSLIIDARGIYYDAQSTCDLEQLLNQADKLAPDLLARASKLRKQIIHLKLSKYNVGINVNLDLPKNKKIILVPGQVESDASILKSTESINTNLALITITRKKNPDAFIIYKPHPDVIAGSRFGKINASALVDIEVTDGNIIALLNDIDEVHTMTSLTGFEALLRKITVVTYGMPFYAGWGLTQDTYKNKRRKNTLSLDQLVAMTLIKYPTYINPQTNTICSIEVALQFLTMKNKSTLPLKIKILRLFKRCLLKK